MGVGFRTVPATSPRSWALHRAPACTIRTATRLQKHWPVAQDPQRHFFGFESVHGCRCSLLVLENEKIRVAIVQRVASSSGLHHHGVLICTKIPVCHGSIYGWVSCVFHSHSAHTHWPILGRCLVIFTRPWSWKVRIRYYREFPLTRLVALCTEFYIFKNLFIFYIRRNISLTWCKV